MDALPYDTSASDSLTGGAQGGATVYITTGVADTTLTIDTQD